jgi:hypothetical protein
MRTKEARLRIGDQICLTNHYLTYPAGTQGTVTHVYRFDEAAYRVCFAGQATDELVYRDHVTILLSRPTSPG